MTIPTPKFSVGDEVRVSDWYFNEFCRNFFHNERMEICGIMGVDPHYKCHRYRILNDGIEPVESILELVLGPW